MKWIREAGEVLGRVDVAMLTIFNANVGNNEIEAAARERLDRLFAVLKSL